jgi:hypothetical protein
MGVLEEVAFADCEVSPCTAPVQAQRPARAMARAPGTARARYETLLADADDANREEFSRFGGTVGRSMFRPGAPHALPWLTSQCHVQHLTHHICKNAALDETLSSS